MTDTDSLRQIAHSRAPFSVWFGTVLLFLLFGAIVLALIGPAPRKDRYEESKAQKRLDNLKTLHEADAKALTGYAWVDKAKGTVHIPIDRAMQLTLAELSRKKPAAAYPIATATPAAAPAAQASPAASSTPKSGSSPAASPAASAGNQPGANSAAPASPAAPGGKPAASPVGTPNQKAPGTPAAGQTPAPTP
jgi:hypothetical protein